jgi:hypothetical protein
VPRHLIAAAGSAAISLLAALQTPVARETLQLPNYEPPAVSHLVARTLQTYDALEADQGVAVDRRFFYAIDNTIIAKYDLTSGRLVGRWVGPRGGLIRHMNSCLADQGRLWCAHSNFPLTPMGSSVEIFDATTLAHLDSHSLGLRDEGSLTWIDRFADGWIAGFAHYNGNGGVGFKTQRESSVVAFDGQWRRTGGWLFPDSVIARMAPHAASGGAVGPDGWLYLMGHDRPELYVTGRPTMGPSLVHIATITVEAEGQAFSWAQDGTRNIFVIDRRALKVRRLDIPTVRGGGGGAGRPGPPPRGGARGGGPGGMINDYYTAEARRCTGVVVE